MRGLLWVAMLLGLAACASMGRPEGGARDEKPPVFVRSNPEPGAIRVSPKRVTITFDENVQLEDAFNKVVVSPAQKTPPTVNANGRRVTVDFRDTLQANTTYTIDFADAIKDLNEGNILDGFALDFSTGDNIDSLRISGTVLAAENLEPAQGILVGVYSNLSDTAITKLPFERIARTNQLGQFTIRGLRAIPYRIFALKDMNRDYHWDRSEDIAFYDTVVVPSVREIAVSDTLYASNRGDSIVTRRGYQYLPNDIFLPWFNENYKASYMLDYKRTDRRKFTINFAAPADSVPQINIVEPAAFAGRTLDSWALTQSNAKRDSIEYWIYDPEVLAVDSLKLSVRYLKTDTLDRLSLTTDSLRFYWREPRKSKKEKNDTIAPPAEHVTISPIGGTQELGRPFRWDYSTPLAALDTAKVHLDIAVDTLWKPVPFVVRTDSSKALLRSYIDINWKSGAKYRLTMDSLATRSIYGFTNRPFKREFTVKQAEEYSNLIFKLPGLDSVPVVMQLLNASDAPIARAVKPLGASDVKLPLLAPGKYYARLFIDTDSNSQWSTGDLLRHIPAEDVYYYPKKIDLKKNWDVELTWNIDELPVDAQKPYAIKKNKPKLKRGEKAPKEEGDEQEEEDSPRTPATFPTGFTGPGGFQRNDQGNIRSR